MSESAKKSWKKGRNISNYHGGITDKNREDRLKTIRLNSLGKILINNGRKEKQIYPDKKEYFLKNGWILGRLKFNENTKLKMSISAKERCKNKKPITTLGRKWMNDGINQKMVIPEEVNLYLNINWKFGFLGKLVKKEGTNV
jgi:hypothetical protein